MTHELTDEELLHVFEAQHPEDAAIIRMIEAGAEVDAVNAIGARSFWRRFKQDARAVEAALLSHLAQRGTSESHIQNLTLLGNAMAHKLKKADPTSGWPAKWGEYVTANGLSSPLRASTQAQPMPDGVADALKDKP